MGNMAERIVSNFQGDGLSIYALLAVLVVGGLAANAYAELLRRRRMRETRGVDDLLRY